MQENEIKIGVVYLCRGGWYRRPTKIDGAEGYVEVTYDLGWTPEVDKSQAKGPLPWFANTAYHALPSNPPLQSKEK